MNVLVVALGVFVTLFGAYSMMYPEGRWIRNWVHPEKWRNEPEAAAREQEEAAGFIGAVVFLTGCFLVVFGLLS